ncbi:MAG: MATE family efflux transporter [Bacteroidales bacterium]|nr:MATE family efflux transporter [Bacteroidales bacterium]
MEQRESTRKQLLRYALPSIIGMLIVGLQTIIDGLFVSRGVGALGLAAVNLSMPLISVMLSVAIMIISGGIVIAGIAQGRGDEERVKGYTTLTFVVLLATILFLSALVALNLKRLCYFLGSNDEVYPFVRQYLGIIGCGFIFYCIPNFTEAFTRLRGRPNWVFTSGVICCVVNVVLDYFFVLRFGWGVAGAAIATCIANTSAALVLLHNVRFGKLVGGEREIRKIFYNGSSEMLTSMSAAVTTYIFNIVLMRDIGPKGVAALTIVCYFNFIVNMSIFGLSQALYPLMSYSVGAKDYKRIKSLLFNSMLFGGCIGVGVYLVVLVFKQGIVGAFSEGDPELHELAIVATTYVTLHYLVSFVNIVASSFHTAIERPLESVVIALCRSIVFVLIPLFVLTPIIGQLGIWLSMPIAEVLTLLVSVPLMWRSLRGLKSPMK